MWLTAAFITTFSALAIYAQECVPDRPANYEDLPEFSEDGNCCYQDPFERKCGNLDFCFGVMISHGSSIHSGCCDLYPSCRSTKSLMNSLDDLRRLSLADLSISAIIFTLTIPHMIMQMIGESNTKLMILSTLILLLEIVDTGISSRIIHIARRLDPEGRTATETADALIGAHCFKHPRDSPTIASIHSELETFETIQILELAFECCLIVMHLAKISCLRGRARLRDQEGGNAETSDKAWETAEIFDTVSVYILDGMELVLAGIAYSVLVSGINDFHGLYDDMKDISARNACIRTCCFIPAFISHLMPKRTPGGAPSMAPTSIPLFLDGHGANLSSSPTPETSVSSFVFTDENGSANGLFLDGYEANLSFSPTPETSASSIVVTNEDGSADGLFLDGYGANLSFSPTPETPVSNSVVTDENGSADAETEAESLPPAEISSIESATDEKSDGMAQDEQPTVAGQIIAAVVLIVLFIFASAWVYDCCRWLCQPGW